MQTAKTLTVPLLAATLVGLLIVPCVHGQSLSLDDNPAFPISSPLGFGLGAEDEFGLTGGPGLAPSPSLPLLLTPLDGTIFTPGLPTLFEMTPNGFEIDAQSTNHFPILQPNLPPITIQFSVDRLTTGAAGSGVAAEFAVGQQPGDIYTSTAVFPSPAMFAGTLGPGPFAGVLPSAGGGGSNALLIDESAFGLTTAAGIVPPGVPAGPIVMGSHDNVDSFDFMPLGPPPGGGPPFGVYPVFSYFAVTPDEAVRVGPPLSAADLIDVAPFAPGGVPFPPYAFAGSMGLDSLGPNTDSIDAVVVFDGGMAPGGPANGGPGAEPVLDFALFSLAPGSASLAPGVLTPGGLSAADVFFTDFTGAFAIFAFDTDVGLVPGAPGFPFQNESNIDALEIRQIPEPTGVGVLLLLVVAGLASRRSRGC